MQPIDALSFHYFLLPTNMPFMRLQIIVFKRKFAHIQKSQFYLFYHSHVYVIIRNNPWEQIPTNFNRIIICEILFFREFYIHVKSVNVVLLVLFFRKIIRKCVCNAQSTSFTCS